MNGIYNSSVIQGGGGEFVKCLQLMKAVLCLPCLMCRAFLSMGGGGGGSMSGHLVDFFCKPRWNFVYANQIAHVIIVFVFHRTTESQQSQEWWWLGK